MTFYFFVWDCHRLSSMRLNPVCESVKVVDLLEDVALPTAHKVAMRRGVLPGRDGPAGNGADVLNDRNPDSDLR